MAVPQKSKGRSSISQAKVKRVRPPKKFCRRKTQNFSSKKFFRRKAQDFSQADSQKPKLDQVDSDAPERLLRRKRASFDSVYGCSETRSSVLERAIEVQASLDPKFPTLVKCMLPSHVSGGFWLGLPKKFCNLHMPKSDANISLEDESGLLYETKYLAEKVGLSAGWRGFAVFHNLVQGDVLIFHLMHPSKFKVYIIRSHGYDEVDGALGLLKLEGDIKQLSVDDPQENCGNSSKMVCDANVPQLHQSENVSEESGSEDLDGIKLSESVISLEEVKGIENFRIIVNGLVIDSEFSNHLRGKYYELCCSQKSYLHDNLLEGLNVKLAAGVISETINIADAIRGSQITISSDSFAIWDQTLRAFEVIGMNVSFLRARLDKLMNLALKLKRYREAESERNQAEEEKKVLVARLVEVKKTIERLDSEIKNQDINSDGVEIVFKELANAPW